jgi:hypothetical protein
LSFFNTVHDPRGLPASDRDRRKGTLRQARQPIPPSHSLRRHAERGRLCDRRFYTLAELKRGDRRTARLTRRQLLEELDRPALKPLPTEPYVFAEWRVRRLGIDYPVEVERHFHSVPYRFARSEVEVRLTGRTVEIFAKGERIAVHMQFIAADHMPSSHRRYADWTIATAGLGAGTQGSAA